MVSLNPLVSVIMPVFNSAPFVAQAIESVQRQAYPHWELIIVNDGSTDDSEKVIESVADPRIRYIFQEHGGVSRARNTGLARMNGEFFCFLDADDYMPPQSLSSRIGMFRHDDSVYFVDGVVLRKNVELTQTISVYQPELTGDPRPALLKLSSACFLGNTWMVRRKKGYRYAFEESLTHLEDFLFFLTLSSHGKYSFVQNEILWYRQSGNSAMANLKGLEKGYWYIYDFIRDQNMASAKQRLYLKYRIIRIMFLSYLVKGRDPGRAFKSLFNLFR